eukprot:TRINITY_DN31286_c0_g1_i1.p1 TRINITY_DN31286_c0_g1~~TRINITY_DN31286_c0_g1_i1.p1  ORF type:complete len:251 (+),score=36.19 TRINITY_DN31286_c0_g1_i1:62-754(+)
MSDGLVMSPMVGEQKMPCKATAKWRGSLRENQMCKEGDCKIYCAQKIHKKNASSLGGSARELLVTEKFLIQVSGVMGTMTRMLPITDIESVMCDKTSGSVVVKVSKASRPPDRDWHFKCLPSEDNTHGAIDDIIDVLNQCRAPYVHPAAAPITLIPTITGKIQDKLTHGMVAPADRMHLYQKGVLKAPEKFVERTPANPSQLPAKYKARHVVPKRSHIVKPTPTRPIENE